MPQEMSAAEAAAIRRLVGQWFARHHRPLPWRTHYDPYQVWIAEIMGQQTQMDRVVEYHRRWLASLPTVEALAQASEDQVLKLWEGLGYYSRARNLRKAAAIMVERHQGMVPDSESALRSLPGIGPYTAAAILSIAFNRPLPLIDANVERLFTRLADLEGDVKAKATRALLETLASRLLDCAEPRRHNQAIMEFGALVCTPRNPDCGSCPLKEHCLAFRRGTVDARPTPKSKKEKIDIVMACAVITHDDRIYIQKRLEDDVWGGLWEFPGGRLKPGETPGQAVSREVREETEWRLSNVDFLATVVHFYTRYRVTLHGFLARLETPVLKPVLHAASAYQWVTLDGLQEFSFPAGHRKLVQMLTEERG